MTRRQFLYDCSAAMAVLAACPVSGLARTANPVNSPGNNPGTFRCLTQISYSQLAAQINTPFRVFAPSGRVVELTLLKAPLAPPSPIVPGRRLPGDFGNENFSLIFSGSRHELLPEAIHRFEHDQLGGFDMYLGQIGARNSEQVRYQSVFNRPVGGILAGS
jgi:hypothetical protein